MSSQIKLFKLLKSPDWDYEYLLELEEFKLKRMLKYFKKSRIIDATFIIRDISICLKCLEIIQEKDKEFLEYLDSSFNSEKLFSLKLGKFSPYVNIRNERRFFRRNVIQKQIEDKEPYLGEEGRQYRILSLKVSLRQMKAFHLYNLIRTYKMQTWWE